MSEDAPDAAGDLRAAIAELRPELLGRARRVIGWRDAEDLVHDTVVRALTFEAGYQERGQGRAWLHRVLWSCFVETFRRRRRYAIARALLADVETSWVHGDPPVEMEALSPGVERALATLPPNVRAPVLLVDVDERSYLEAAAALGIPTGTLMSRLHRGRQRLRAQLQEEEPLC